MLEKCKLSRGPDEPPIPLLSRRLQCHRRLRSLKRTSNRCKWIPLACLSCSLSLLLGIYDTKSRATSLSTTDTRTKSRSTTLSFVRSLKRCRMRFTSEGNDSRFISTHMFDEKCKVFVKESSLNKRTFYLYRYLESWSLSNDFQLSIMT